MRDRRPSIRWLFVLAGGAALGVAGTYQFVWSSIRPELGARLVASEASLGTVFTVYVVAQTLSQFPAGRFRDRHGPRLPMLVGAALIAVGYIGTGLATETAAVYLAYGAGGAGAGVVYTVAVNTPVKWFTERRGLATGVVTLMYSGLSVLFIPFVREGVQTDFETTLFLVGAATGLAALLGALVLRDPADPADEDPDPETAASERAYGWREAIRTWQFWVLYVMLVAVNGVGLMLIGKAVAFVEHFGFPGALATAAASAVALSDAAGILAVGGLSDRLGRERTLAASVTICGLVLAAAVPLGEMGAGVAFVAALGAAAFFRSPVFSVVPALVGEYYGPARSSENYALLYTAKVWGGVGGGVVASGLIADVGWEATFLIGAAAMTAVGLLAGLLRPVE